MILVVMYLQNRVHRGRIYLVSGEQRSAVRTSCKIHYNGPYRRGVTGHLTLSECCYRTFNPTGFVITKNVITKKKCDHKKKM